MAGEIVLGCKDCGSEFTANYNSDRCPDCGGRLRQLVLHLDRAAYLGGHRRHDEPVSHAVVAIYEDGISIDEELSGRHILSFAADEITAVEVDGPTEVRSRVTVPRILALGWLALAVPKKEKLSYLVITSTDGEAIVELHSMSAMEARAALQPLSNLFAAPPPTAVTASSRARLVELKSLHDEGLINDEEYATRRVEVLKEL